jgi:hypothetical protein
MSIAEVNTFAGRYYLSVAGVVIATQGDPCRDNEFPEEVLDPIPQNELEHARIGDKRAAELPIEVVRFFRGDRWTPKMLEYVAEKINASSTAPTPSAAATQAASNHFPRRLLTTIEANTRDLSNEQQDRIIGAVRRELAELGAEVEMGRERVVGQLDDEKVVDR